MLARREQGKDVRAIAGRMYSVGWSSVVVYGLSGLEVFNQLLFRREGKGSSDSLHGYLQ